jgi:hypothetical protein
VAVLRRLRAQVHHMGDQVVAWGGRGASRETVCVCVCVSRGHKVGRDGEGGETCMTICGGTGLV